MQTCALSTAEQPSSIPGVAFALTKRTFPLLCWLSCAGGPAVPATQVPEVHLLKNPVLLYEPVYAEVHNESLVREEFEVRLKPETEWEPCPTARAEARPSASESVSVYPFRLNDFCKFPSTGVYEIRWGGGAVTELTVQPIPPSELAGSELMRRKKMTRDLAASVYAGYVLVHPGPHPTFAPNSEMSFRLSYDEERRAAPDERVRAQEERSLQKQLAEFTELVAQLAIHLEAHPEFPFADDARLERSGLLVFLGRCDEAALELRQVQSTKWAPVAKHFLVELEAVKSAPNSVCRSTDAGVP
jgi:hypothetical protein